MASSSSLNRKRNGGGGVCDIPSSIISLPARLQKKIQRETANDRHVSANNCLIGKEKQQNDEILTNFLWSNKDEIEKQRQKCCSITEKQSPRRESRKENEMFPTNIFLTREKSQNTLKDLSVRKNSIPEPPIWLKNSETIEKNDYWCTKMQNLTKLHLKYFELINENDESILENWKTIKIYRKDLNDIFSYILETNLKFCCKENIEIYFWKTLYYNLIERLRRNIQELQQQQQQKQISSNTSSYAIKILIQDIKTKSFELIKDGHQFYETKLNYLEEKYLNDKSLLSNRQQKFELLAKILMQKFLIHLGDLSRYKEQIENGTNFTKSKLYYQRAQQLVPSNGIPYNQLAILSIYYKKTFDAIYYYMRSLCASNPINSAKESLNELFDEIRKKYNENFKQQKSTNEITIINSVKHELTEFKKEIWIHPNGSKRLHRFDDGNSTTPSIFKNLNNLQPDELLKRFTSNYLYILGRLFTGIEMENLQKILPEMLNEFKSIIFYNNSTITNTFSNKNRLLQIIALNIFVIEHNRFKENQQNGTNNVTNRDSSSYHAFHTSTLIFGIILNRINEDLKELFSEYSNSSSSSDEDSPTIIACTNVLKLNISNATVDDVSKKIPKKLNKKHLNFTKISDELKILLKSVKIWCDWLKKNIEYWNPPKLSLGIYNCLYDEIDPWNNLAQLSTLLSCIDFPVKINDECNFKLPENIYLDGFLPLNSNDSMDTIIIHDTKKIFNDDQIEIIKRLQIIKDFASVTLCECEPPVFEKITDSNGSIVYIKNILKQKTIHNNCTLESFDDIPDYDLTTTAAAALPPITLASPEEIDTSTSHNLSSLLLNDKSENFTNDFDEIKQQNNDKDHCNDIVELIKRKNELEKKTKQRQMYQQKLENLLENSEIIFHIEVHPKYLIPDTNCFIDFLHLLKTIALNSSKRYILAIPTVVCNELEGLSKGFKISNISTLQATSSAIRHFDEVTIRAREAMDFIKCEKHISVKYVTTKGSILNTSNFIIEEEIITNDDNNATMAKTNFIMNTNCSGKQQLKLSTNSNDDRILQTAENLCKRTNIEKKSKGKIHIQTEVVLLTTDRNLRVKALSRNLSVSQLNEFLNWAKINK